LDNILLDESLNPKIIDFGISSIVEPGKKIYDTGGTPAYLAPEVIAARGEVGYKSDVWSLGVLLYLLTFGKVPFKAKEMQRLYEKILIGTFRFPKNNVASSLLIDLISSMIVLDIDDRFSIEDILSHPWLSQVKINNNQEKSQSDRISMES
jgi:serine/threonine protein kinase